MLCSWGGAAVGRLLIVAISLVCCAGGIRVAFAGQFRFQDKSAIICVIVWQRLRMTMLRRRGSIIMPYNMGRNTFR